MNATTSQTVTRYVITHVETSGLRSLAQACQGRYTYATPEGAQAMLDAIRSNNSTAIVAEFFNGADVRACECWAGHFDPVGCYFDE